MSEFMDATEANTEENLLENLTEIARTAGLDIDSPADTVTGVRSAVYLCHALAALSGWWTDPTTKRDVDPHNPTVFAAKLALVHSEISEALEADRKGLNDDHLPHREGAEVELADAVIRIFDLAGSRGMDLETAILEKLLYNQYRADHKLANRSAANGKAI